MNATVLIALAGIAAAVVSPVVQARLARASGLRDQRTRAAEAYLAAVIAIHSELSQLPAIPDRKPGRIRRLCEPHGGESLLYIYARVGERLVFGKRPRELSDRIADAYARVVAAQPSQQLVAAMDAVNDYFLDWRNPDPGRRAEWHTLNQQLAQAVAAEASR
jgi:hypothetical protein